MIFCGLVGATLAGLLIDFTKLFKDVAVVSLGLGILSFVWFTEVSTRVLSGTGGGLSFVWFRGGGGFSNGQCTRDEKT